MEFQTTSITLDKPLIEQQAFKSFLKLTNDQSHYTIELHNLLDVAKVIIKNKLATCGCSEAELISFRLECQVSQPESDEPEKIYSNEWNNLSQKDANKNTERLLAVVPAIENSVSSEFRAKLIERLDEVIMEFSPLTFLEGHIVRTSTTFNFSSGRTTIDTLECSNDCIVNGKRYKKNLTTGKCTQRPCRIMRFPRTPV